MNMSNEEFEILDELYFVITFSDLSNELPDYNNEKLFGYLTDMIGKDWLRVYKGDIELENNEISFDLESFTNYSFLASKKGLFAHNSR